MKKHDILNTIGTVDLWSQLSCLGSMQYAVSAYAIRKAMKLIPDDPTPETIEAFFNDERNIKLDVEYAGPDEHGELVNKTHQSDVETTPGNHLEARRELQALLDLRQDFLDMSEELGSGLDQGEERSLTNTMLFMANQNKVDPAKFKQQYINNKRIGLKNYGQTMAMFVNQETIRATEAQARFAAKGEYAVQFLEGLDPLEGPISDTMIETLCKRCVDKLIMRRIKIGKTLGWSTGTTQRCEAEADITFIEQAIVALGGEVPNEAIVPDEANKEIVTINDLMAMMQQMQVNDPKAPGPVTIIKH